MPATAYRIKHIATGTLSQMAYTSMTAATLAIFDAAPHSQSEFDVVLVTVDDEPLKGDHRCGECDTLLLDVGTFLFCPKPSCSMYERDQADEARAR